MNTFPQDIAPLLAQFAGPSGIKKLGSTDKRNYYATEKTLQLSKKKNWMPSYFRPVSFSMARQCPIAGGFFHPRIETRTWLSN